MIHLRKVMVCAEAKIIQVYLYYIKLMLLVLFNKIILFC